MRPTPQHLSPYQNQSIYNPFSVVQGECPSALAQQYISQSALDGHRSCNVISSTSPTAQGSYLPSINKPDQLVANPSDSNANTHHLPTNITPTVTCLPSTSLPFFTGHNNGSYNHDTFAKPIYFLTAPLHHNTGHIETSLGHHAPPYGRQVPTAMVPYCNNDNSIALAYSQASQARHSPVDSILYSNQYGSISLAFGEAHQNNQHPMDPFHHCNNDGVSASTFVSTLLLYDGRNQGESSTYTAVITTSYTKSQTSEVQCMRN